MSSNIKKERIAKVIARSGICSRRDAEKLILENRVSVNKEQISTPATLVDYSDVIKIDGELIPQKQETRIWLYHKPSGFVTSNKDEKGRRTVFDNLPKNLPRTISVGRLDINTEGLLILTNNGETARFLELPSTGWKRKYRVRVYGTIEPNKLEKLKDGITIAGINYGSIEVKIETEGKANTWLEVTLSEGKNREIKKVLEHFDLRVSRLIRTSYGPFQLGKMKVGEVAEVRTSNIKNFIPKKVL